MLLLEHHDCCPSSYWYPYISPPLFTSLLALICCAASSELSLDPPNLTDRKSALAGNRDIGADAVPQTPAAQMSDLLSPHKQLLFSHFILENRDVEWIREEMKREFGIDARWVSIPFG